MVFHVCCRQVRLIGLNCSWKWCRFYWLWAHYWQEAENSRSCFCSQYLPVIALSCFCCPLCRTGIKLEGSAEGRRKMKYLVSSAAAQKVPQVLSRIMPCSASWKGDGPWMTCPPENPPYVSFSLPRYQAENQVMTPLTVPVPFNIKRWTPCCIFSDEPTLPLTGSSQGLSLLHRESS